MKPQTLTGFERYGKTTRRAQFLADMDRVIPWPELAAAVETVYPKISEAGGWPPIPLERMLRVYFLQLWFNLSDPAIEEAVYDSVAMRNFAGIDLGMEGAPDETTVCKFRHLLERNKLGKTLLRAVNDRGIWLTSRERGYSASRPCATFAKTWHWSLFKTFLGYRLPPDSSIQLSDCYSAPSLQQQR